jgi:hypothetical protein
MTPSVVAAPAVSPVGFFLSGWSPSIREQLAIAKWNYSHGAGWVWRFEHHAAAQEDHNVIFVTIEC